MTTPTALIIIDMQKGMRSPKLPPRNNPDAEDNIARLHAAWREAGQPVISVRHISRSPTSVFAPGQEGVEFQERFTPLAHEHLVEKNVPDAFINTGLERWLHARGIRRLVIVGVSTNNSVEASARTAGNLGFETVVVADACFSFEKQDFGGTLRSAEEVHLMALANLDGEYARVLSTEQVLHERLVERGTSVQGLK
jgi:nicotinamidase-related amidase